MMVRDEEDFWIWRGPDGIEMHISNETPPTYQLEMELIEHWFTFRTSGFKIARAEAEFELIKKYFPVPEPGRHVRTHR